MVRAIEREFSGVTAADGSLDRQKLSAKVFGNPAALQKLNQITHLPYLTGCSGLRPNRKAVRYSAKCLYFLKPGCRTDLTAR